MLVDSWRSHAPALRLLQREWSLHLEQKTTQRLALLRCDSRAVEVVRPGWASQGEQCSDESLSIAGMHI